jgi:hypothetical protein
VIKIFQASFDFEISNAIVIAIEILIRIDRTLIEHGLNESGFMENHALGATAPHAREKPNARSSGLLVAR